MDPTVMCDERRTARPVLKHDLHNRLMKTTYQITFIILLLLFSCDEQYLAVETGIDKKGLPKFAYSSLDKEEKLANALEGFKRKSTNGSPGARIRNTMNDIDPDSIFKSSSVR
jgi:hypothetical protein